MSLFKAFLEGLLEAFKEEEVKRRRKRRMMWRMYYK